MSVSRKSRPARRNITHKSKKQPNYSVIITASFISSHPSIEFIKATLDSLEHANLNKNTPVILAHDYSSDGKFIEYLKNLKRYIANKKNIKLVVRKSPGHLTGNIRNAFKYVKTEYVLIIQHDFPFIRSFDIEKIIDDMKENPELKHIKFNKRANIKIHSNAINDLFGKEVKSSNYTYTRTPSWSDNNHICRSDYYRNIILKECNNGKPMESYLMNKSKTRKIHDKYGTYIFGPINQRPYIKHLDGRKRKHL